MRFYLIGIAIHADFFKKRCDKGRKLVRIVFSPLADAGVHSSDRDIKRKKSVRGIAMPELIYCTDTVARRKRLCDLCARVSDIYENVYIVVPEQQVLETEEMIFSREVPENIEVTSFKRLSNNIFRKFGGLCYNYIGSGAKQVVMWRALMSCIPSLRIYSDISLEDMSAVKLILSAVEEMKMCGVSPGILEKTSYGIADEKLSDKLSDVSLIYSAYESIMSGRHDDAADDLARACGILEENDFFLGSYVIFDSFDGFTQAEYAIIEKVFLQAADSAVFLSFDISDRRKMFDGPRRTDRTLRRLCAGVGKGVNQVFDTEKNAVKDKMIAEFSRHFHDGSDYRAASSDSWDDGIKAVVCPTPEHEARFVACDIARRVQSGARYRDFAVIMRSTDKYRGIIDAFLDDCRIPFFISSRKDLSSAAEIRMICSALAVCAYNFRYEDVVSYMRSGLSGLSSDECDILEEYASLWRISGSRWHDEYGWQMNPKGFSADFDEETIERLALLNELKERLTAPLCALSDSFGPAATVRSISAALFSFFNEINLSEKLSARREYDKSLFGPEEAGLGGQIYDCVIDVLDQLVLTAGDVRVNASEYSRLFMAVISESDVGRLPSRIDEVTVGSADLIRKSHIKHVYIMGLNEGEFPAPVKENGFFDDDEKRALSELGITTSAFGEQQQYDEELYFFRAVCSASDSVCLTSCEKDMNSSKLCPSPFFSDTVNFLPTERALRYDDIPKRDLLYAVSDIIEYAVRNNDNDLLYRVSACSDSPLDSRIENIPGDICDKIYGEKMVLTQSRMEKYVMCSFAYHCAYGMKLRSTSDGRFEGSDVGNYIHKVLENFFAVSGGRLRQMSDEEAYILLDRVTDEYMSSIGAKGLGKRFQVLARRLKRSARLLLKNLLSEFRSSDFTPRFFEFPIDMSGEGGARAQRIPLPDGGEVFLVGKIDRVDTYEKDGNVYIRVVDYKTGSKTFSMNDVKLGLNLQMLIYLFALCSEENSVLREKTACKEQLIPAGAVYISSISSVKESEQRPANAEEAEEYAQSVISRSGILLADPDILLAMDKDASGKYVTIKGGKDGGVKSASAALLLEDIEEMGRLAAQVRDIVAGIAVEMKKGRADARPLRDSSHNACEYCPYKPVCRIKDSKESEPSKESELSKEFELSKESDSAFYSTHGSRLSSGDRHESAVNCSDDCRKMTSDRSVTVDRCEQDVKSENYCVKGDSNG